MPYSDAMRLLLVAQHLEGELVLVDQLERAVGNLW